MVFLRAQRDGREHHRGMTRRIQKVIAPKEWDFRLVPKDELYAASEYEYARELVSPVQARKARRLLKEYANSGKRELFDEWFSQRGYDKPGEEEFLRKIARPTMDNVPLPLMFFAQKFPLFPRAWLKLPDKTRAKYVKETVRRGGIKEHIYYGFSDLNDYYPEMSPEEMGRLMQSGKLGNDQYGTYGFHPIKINWDWSNKEINKSFSSWVKHARPEDVKEVTLRGKTTIPNDDLRLKWLSAYRLQRAGWSFKKAQTKFETYLSECDPNSDPPPTLPYYKHLSGWDGAIKKAKGHLRKIAPRSA